MAIVLSLSEAATMTFMEFMLMVAAVMGVNRDVIMIWNLVLAGREMVLSW